MNRGVNLDDARAAKGEALEVFRELVGEVSVGIKGLGQGRYGLKVNLTAAPEEDVSLPDEINGVPVQVEIVGRIRKL